MGMHPKTSEQDAGMGLVCESVDCALFQMRPERDLTDHEIIPGVYVFHRDTTFETTGLGGRDDLFVVDHCLEGRIEWESTLGTCQYLESGNVALSTKESYGALQFPLGLYRGLSIVFDIPRAQQSLNRMMPGWSIDLLRLRAKFCGDGETLVLRDAAELNQLCCEMYTVHPRIQMPYSQVKVMELLLLLEVAEPPSNVREPRYFRRTQIDKVKDIATLITSELDRWYTLAELSERFDFPLTSMQQCFRNRYGVSIAAYMKEYRMNAAAVRLRNSDDPVIDIASEVGYSNPGKFAAAFRSVMGKTPTEYRSSARV
ncbi:helix-turn-helix domain-containing protein [Bifidobacterium choloepi]|uniref:Helix-turn-helix transcriptional regulator n=1 Tax=Bifidobacterium choloepi TaxID=2614131 RepID=A0A6I5N0A7_9BIFI|nr:AraC family transcriptional regulator [Bifidobacterium choloepi]NEG69555.1 helix-turn-helix transcriptional regulator [Bifidobacterium choloepi]